MLYIARKRVKEDVSVSYCAPYGKADVQASFEPKSGANQSTIKQFTSNKQPTRFHTFFFFLQLMNFPEAT